MRPKNIHQFEIEGSVVYETETGDETVRETRRFILSRDGVRWGMRTTPLPDEKQASAVVLFDEAAHDGTNIFRLTLFDKRKCDVPADAPYKREDIVPAQGRVHEANCPPCLDIDFVYPLWLAYCSSHYFSELQGDRIVAPLFVPLHSFEVPVPQRYDLPAKWRLNPCSIVEKIEWFSDGRTPEYECDGTFRLETYPPPFDDGFLHATYEVHGWTAFGELVLPASFELKVLQPRCGNSDATAADLDPCFVITGTVETVRALAGVVCPPKLTTKTLITDSRYPLHGKPICYGSESKWMTVEEIKAKLRRIALGLDPGPACRC